MTKASRPATTDAVVAIHLQANGVFLGLIGEVRELSKKKPEATLSAAKVVMINRVLTDLLSFLKNEPAGKYLEELDTNLLPQMSDALLIMVQFERALRDFERKYKASGTWITVEYLQKQDEEDPEDFDDDEVDIDEVLDEDSMG